MARIFNTKFLHIYSALIYVFRPNKIWLTSTMVKLQNFSHGHLSIFARSKTDWLMDLLINTYETYMCSWDALAVASQLVYRNIVFKCFLELTTCYIATYSLNYMYAWSSYAMNFATRYRTDTNSSSQTSEATIIMNNCYHETKPKYKFIVTIKCSTNCNVYHTKCNGIVNLSKP